MSSISRAHTFKIHILVHTYYAKKHFLSHILTLTLSYSHIDFSPTHALTRTLTTLSEHSVIHTDALTPLSRHLVTHTHHFSFTTTVTSLFIHTLSLSLTPIHIFTTHFSYTHAIYHSHTLT
jgi:hypothetical protein